MAKKKRANTNAEQTSRPPVPSAPQSEPASLEESDRLNGWRTLLSEIKSLGLRKPDGSIRFVANPQGISPTWEKKVIFKLMNDARAGRPVPWEVTDIPTGKMKIVQAPLFEVPRRVRHEPSRRGAPRKVPPDAFQKDLNRFPGSSQAERARRLSISERTVRDYLKKSSR